MAKNLGLTSIRHRSDTKVSGRCVIEVNLRVFAIWTLIKMMYARTTFCPLSTQVVSCGAYFNGLQQDWAWGNSSALAMELPQFLPQAINSLTQINSLALVKLCKFYFQHYFLFENDGIVNYRYPSKGSNSNSNCTKPLPESWLILNCNEVRWHSSDGNKNSNCQTAKFEKSHTCYFSHISQGPMSNNCIKAFKSYTDNIFVMLMIQNYKPKYNGYHFANNILT